MPARLCDITDDRGARVAVRDWESPAMGVSVGRLRERSLLGRQTGLEKTAVVISIASMPVTISLVHGLVPGNWYILALPVVFGLHLVVPSLMLARSRGAKIRKAAVIALESGQCPGCRYELVDLPVEKDDCAVCPECGAAWRSHRIGTGAGPDAPAATGSRGGVASLLALFGGFSQPDALGRPCHGPPLVAIRMVRASEKTGRARDLLRAVRVARRSGLFLRTACSGLFLLLAVAVGLIALRPTSLLFGVPVPSLGLIMGVLAFITLAVLLLGSDAFVANRARVAALLSAAFCPACGRDLRGCSRDGGKLTCPECSAAWQLGR